MVFFSVSKSTNFEESIRSVTSKVVPAFTVTLLALAVKLSVTLTVPVS